MMVRLLLVCVGIAGVFQGLQAQSVSSLRRKFVYPADTIFIDSLSLQPGTLAVLGAGTFLDCYELDALRARLIRRPGCTERFSDSVEVQYRVFPLSLYQTYKVRGRRFAGPDERGMYNPFVFTPEERLQVEPGFKGLQKNGSISRGLSLGNNQDMSVNSTLNLQLSGKLTPDIDISAAITDDNIPIQPDGNTQQLQDFDRVYIQLSNASSKLVVGDFQITRPESYFMNFNKRLQGAGFQTNYPLRLREGKPEFKMKTAASAAIARGRFNRNQVQGIEGNQGPYRLQGTSNEQYIIILSGSEKVYIDGKLLKRGQEFDYIIDYNAAEITFTSRNLITKDRRIFVEFEYSDRNYVRTFLHLNQDIQQGRYTGRINLYSEQDNKKQPLQQTLEAPEREVLRSAGDDLLKAVVPSIDSTGFLPEMIQYRMKDSLVNGVVYSQILEFSTEPEQAHYRATFTNVGANKGHYIQTNSSANGRVFQWVAPVNGVPQGSFAPLSQLIPPTRRQMLSWGNDVQVSKHLLLNAELALSDFDGNTFSNLDSKDDQGYALRFSATDTRKIGDDSIPYNLQTTLSYEQVDRNFKQIERFRNVEFDRDWNLIQTNAGKQTEYLPRFNMVLSQGSKLYASYLFTGFIRGTESAATQHHLQVRNTDAKNEISYQGSLTNTQTGMVKAGFYRHKSRFARKLGPVKIGYEDEFEQNRLLDIPKDTLRKTSYRFYDRQVFLGSADTGSRNFNLFYRVRTDESPGVNKDDFTRYARAEQVGLSLSLQSRDQIRFTNTSSYRRLSISDTSVTSQKPEETLLNRVELSLRFFKSAITSVTFYEIGSGQETRKEFSYLEVQPGQGVYQWTDYNNNAIRELNEFELAAFPDQARYIRIYTPTRDFIRVYYNQFNEIFNLRAPNTWHQEKGLKKFVARFSVQSAMRIDSKSKTDDFFKAADPMAGSLEDSLLITLNQSFRNSLFINKSDPVFGLDLNWQKLASKALLNNGLEARDHSFYQYRVRWNPGSRFGFNLETRNGTKSSQAAYFGNRNYRIRYYDIEPAVSYQSGAVFKLILKYKQGRRKNDSLLGGEQAFIHNGGLELRYNVASKGSFQTTFNLIQIAFEGVQSSPVAFEMLEGLRQGRNYTWGASYQRTLANNMQINFNYDGRKSQDVPVVHIGSVQIRVFF
ncbi:MAG: hypothetical protein K1X77_08100 [Bacteroidia bacterium]|nr:hypothetical protein [Bacteroidia bacterium]